MVEKAKSLTLSRAKRSEYGETGKYVDFTDGEGGKATVGLNRDAIDKDLRFAGFNLIVTSETKMTDQDIYNTYHNLWRIGAVKADGKYINTTTYSNFIDCIAKKFGLPLTNYHLTETQIKSMFGHRI